MNKVDEMFKSKGYTKTETRVYINEQLTEATLEYKFIKECGNKLATWWVRSVVVFNLLDKTFRIVDSPSNNKYISQLEIHQLIDMKLKELGWIK